MNIFGCFKKITTDLLFARFINRDLFDSPWKSFPVFMTNKPLEQSVQRVYCFWGSGHIWFHISTILCPNWADLSITCSRHGWLNDEWHCSDSRRPVKGICWPASACLEILYQIKRGISSNLSNCITNRALPGRYYWLLAYSPLKKYDPFNWTRKMFFPRWTRLSIVTSK